MYYKYIFQIVIEYSIYYTRGWNGFHTELIFIFTRSGIGMSTQSSVRV